MILLVNQRTVPRLTGGVDIIVPHPVHDLPGPQTVDVVVVADSVGPVRRRGQLPAVLPGHGPARARPDVVVARRVTGPVVDVSAGDAHAALRPFDLRQLVQPVFVPVGVVDCVGPVGLLAEIAEGVVLVVPGSVDAADRLGKLTLVVVGPCNCFHNSKVNITVKCDRKRTNF